MQARWIEGKNESDKNYLKTTIPTQHQGHDPSVNNSIKNDHKKKKKAQG